MKSTVGKTRQLLLGFSSPNKGDGKNEHFSMKYCKEEEFYAEGIRKMKPICQCSSKSTDGKMFHPLEGIFPFKNAKLLD